jgi:hypothetical protein
MLKLEQKNRCDSKFGGQENAEGEVVNIFILCVETRKKPR